MRLGYRTEIDVGARFFSVCKLFSKLSYGKVLKCFSGFAAKYILMVGLR